MSASPVSARGGASVPGGILTTTLRALLDQRRKDGQFLRLDEAIAIIVPLCLDLKQRHERGEKLYVHPSSVGRGPDGMAAILPRASLVPIQARDRACVAPELQGTLEPGPSKASVFSVGAILYEMLTAYPIGPAMRRPREVNPELPDAVEILLSKALVSDPQHRPDDLGALASALHHLAPMESISPPDADETALDRSDEYAVDVRMSMLPPHELVSMVPLVSAAPAPMTSIPISMSGFAPERAGSPSGAPLVIPQIPAMPAVPAMPNIPAVPPSTGSAAMGGAGPISARDPAIRLMELKARLESDPRPRYTVHQNRMDHGPFTAVELLQQIASNKFRPEDGIRDELSGQDRPIKDWEEFAPFAEQAKLRRDIAIEKKEVSALIEQEKSTGLAKAIIAGSVVVALLGGVGFWFFEVRGSRNDSVDIADDPGALDISIDGGARITMKRGNATGGGGAGGKAPSGYAPGGMSYEAALNSNKEEITIGNKAGPDLSDGQLAGPLRNASFIAACGVPSNMHVTVRTAIKSGRAVGVSVSTDPPNGAMASCVDRSVRGLSWPSNPHMDSFTTRY
jgi:hypothetical protein